MKSRSPFTKKNPIIKKSNSVVNGTALLQVPGPKPSGAIDFGNAATRPFKTNIPDEKYKEIESQNLYQKIFGTNPMLSENLSQKSIQSEKYPLSTYQRDHILADNEPEDKWHKRMDVKNIREKYLKASPYNTENAKVDFESALPEEESRQFVARYNHPVTRKRLKDQAGMTDEDIDNFILTGLTAKKEDTNQVSFGSDATYIPSSNKILIKPDLKHYKETLSHERVHASRIDNVMGKYLQKTLGSSWHQENTNNWNRIKDYMNKPHEAYANFAGFREQIGLKPGEQIDAKELDSRVEAKDLRESNFWQTYDKDKILKALNTVASSDSKPTGSWVSKHRNA